jgi:tRNA nucleotidyltransferase/poly(A) polymerase
MRQAGVLSRVLPESEKWGIDAVHALLAAECDLGWPADPLLRLMAMLPPDAARLETMARRLRLSRAEARRLTAWAETATPAADATEAVLERQLYYGEAEAVSDRLRLALAAARGRAEADTSALVAAGGYARLLAHAGRWSAPKMPISGLDLKPLGAPGGPALGALLRALEAAWVESRFTLSGEALKARAAALIRKEPSGGA